MDFLKNTFRVELWLRPVFLILLLCFCVPTNSDAQYKYDYEWLFGYNGEDWNEPRFAINLLSFHSNPPDTIRTSLVGSTGVATTVSLADSNGDILFYSNGCRLFNSDGSMVEGGEVLLNGPMYNQFCYIDDIRIEYYPTWIQSRFILPMDENDSLFFFLYHRWELTHNTDFEEPRGIVAFDLHLGKIENSENGYRMKSPEVILGQMMSNGNMAAIKSNLPDHWWIIVPPHIENNFEIIHLGPKGVDTVYTYFAEFPEFLENKFLTAGQSAVCPNGKKYALWSPADTAGTLIFDFDRTTGELSNMQHLPHPERDSFVLGISSGGGGAAISPSGRFLYVNTRNNLYQYDLEASDIAGSIVHIAEYDGFRDPGNNFQTAFFMQQLAPDCRIYMSSTNTVSWLHVINYPDRKGKACDFRQHSLKLPGNHRFGLPYHPNYRLGTGYPVCDSTLTSTTWFVPEESGPALHLYPNPAREYAVVGWSKMEPEEIAIYDLSGRELYRSRMQPGLPEYYLDLSGYSAGVYLVRVRDRSGVVRVERLVVSF